MTEWARRENGAVVEIVTSFLTDEDFLAMREGQDLVPMSEIPYADLSVYIQQEAARLGQPPRPLGLVQPLAEEGPHSHEEAGLLR